MTEPKTREWSKETHTISLFHRKVASPIIGGEEKDVFQWHDNTGKNFSPEFDDIYDAFDYVKHTGLKEQK